MPEHTPAPTPSRSVYGFVLYLLSSSAFILYVVWAFVPDWLLDFIGLTYLPQKYWAIALPIYVCVGIALAFITYPAVNMIETPQLDDLRTITDSHSLKLEDKCNVHSGIPPVYDIPISEVCRQLYQDSM